MGIPCRREACLLAAAAILVFATRARSQENGIRKDALGNSLPAASQIRYGASRLRHEQPVQAVALSPDGRFIASSARDFNIRIWDRSTGALVHSLLEPTNRLAFGAPESSTPCLRFTPDGKYLVAGRGDAKLLVWETSGYKLLHTLSGSTGAIQALTIAPDSKTCASADSEQIVRFWNLAEGKETKQLTIQERAVRSSLLTMAPSSLPAAMTAACGFGNWIHWPKRALLRLTKAPFSIWHGVAGRVSVLASSGLDNSFVFGMFARNPILS